MRNRLLRIVLASLAFALVAVTALSDQKEPVNIPQLTAAITAAVLEALGAAAPDAAPKEPKPPAAQPVVVRKVIITARSPGVDFESWTNEAIKFDAPQVPAPGAIHSLDDLIGCPPEFTPEAAWSEIVTSWPEPGVMYGVNADVTKDGSVRVALRTRQRLRGYAYVEIYLLCWRNT